MEGGDRVLTVPLYLRVEEGSPVLLRLYVEDESLRRRP